MDQFEQWKEFAKYYMSNREYKEENVFSRQRCRLCPLHKVENNCGRRHPNRNWKVYRNHQYKEVS